MTDNDYIDIIYSFRNLRMLPGTWDKRFVNNMVGKLNKNEPLNLTETQKEWIMRILYKYRNQLPKVYPKYNKHPHCSKK